MKKCFLEKLSWRSYFWSSRTKTKVTKNLNHKEFRVSGGSRTYSFTQKRDNSIDA